MAQQAPQVVPAVQLPATSVVVVVDVEGPVVVEVVVSAVEVVVVVVVVVAPQQPPDSQYNAFVEGDVSSSQME